MKMSPHFYIAIIAGIVLSILLLTFNRLLTRIEQLEKGLRQVRTENVEMLSRIESIERRAHAVEYVLIDVCKESGICEDVLAARLSCNAIFPAKLTDFVLDRKTEKLPELREIPYRLMLLEKYLNVKYARPTTTDAEYVPVKSAKPSK